MYWLFRVARRILYVGMRHMLEPAYHCTYGSGCEMFSFITGGGAGFILGLAIMITFVDIGKKLDEDSDAVNLLLYLAGSF